MKKTMNKLKQVGVAVLMIMMLGACTPHQAINTIFTGSDNEIAHRVVQCESGYDVTEVSKTNDHGLFQINATTWNKPWHPDPVAQWIGRHWHLRYDPVYNTLMAKMIRQKYGWSQWTCY